ncbi:hypothetical protein CHS0354_002324 [Potamilus streckersoni]|uniref:Uncharacterized protein n=1 Tax=Potamilus streckersoni TaxID=2493646 RepID=A0AAE0SN76_9BIVA|nr:hypothetical protein CHS0354_002324 [Potamilus streckersoni]
MFKNYIKIDSQVNHAICLVVPVPPTEDLSEEIQSDTIDLGAINLRNSEIIKNLDHNILHLQQEERNELKHLLFEYEHLFPDIYTCTDKNFHEVEIVDSKPVKQHPYRMNPLKQDYLKKEIQYLLENDFI